LVVFKLTILFFMLSCYQSFLTNQEQVEKMGKILAVLVVSMFHETTAAGLALLLKLNFISAFILIIFGSSLTLSLLIFLPRLITKLRLVLKPSVISRLEKINNHEKAHQLSVKVNEWLDKKKLKSCVWIAIFILSASPIPYTIHVGIIINWQLNRSWGAWIILGGNAIRTLIVMLAFYGGYWSLN